MLSEDNPRRDLIWRRGEKRKGCWRSENVSYSDTLGESYPLLHSTTSGEFLRTLSFRSPEGVTSSRKEEVTCLLSWETSLETIALNSASNLQYRTLFSSRVKGHFSLMLFQRTRYPGLRSIWPLDLMKSSRTPAVNLSDPHPKITHHSLVIRRLPRNNLWFFA